MSSEIATNIPREDARQRVARRPWRALAVQLLGPLTILGGLVWAIAQPYRIVLLDRAGQGVYDYLFQPPLLVVIVGLVFALAHRSRARRGPRGGGDAMVPRAESAHWLAAAIALLIGLLLIAEADRRHRGLPPACLARLSLPGRRRRARASGCG